MPGPLVVMTRKQKTAGGRAIRVDPTSVRLGDAVLTANGTHIDVALEGHTSPRESGERFTLTVEGDVLDVVCFRAGEKSRPVPTGRVMKAIEAVRADDRDDARRVLSDVLEESGALAEAEYVRLELELQRRSEPSSPGFIEGVAQLRVLSSVVGPTFRYLVGRDIDGCAGVRWAFRCPASWDSMTPTSNERERVCVSCRQLVVQVTSEEEASRLAAEGVCAQVRVEEDEWVGEVAAPWVGSIAAPPPDDEPEPEVPAADAPQKKSWWQRLFGR